MSTKLLKKTTTVKSEQIVGNNNNNNINADINVQNTIDEPSIGNETFHTI